MCVSTFWSFYWSEVVTFPVGGFPQSLLMLWESELYIKVLFWCQQSLNASLVVKRKLSKSTESYFQRCVNFQSCLLTLTSSFFHFFFTVATNLEHAQSTKNAMFMDKSEFKFSVMYSETIRHWYLCWHFCAVYLQQVEEEQVCCLDPLLEAASLESAFHPLKNTIYLWLRVSLMKAAETFY